MRVIRYSVHPNISVLCLFSSLIIGELKGGREEGEGRGGGRGRKRREDDSIGATVERRTMAFVDLRALGGL